MSWRRRILGGTAVCALALVGAAWAALDEAWRRWTEAEQ